MNKFLIEYKLPYMHVVRVGIKAESGAAAIAIAQEAFDHATIWDNTPEIPLLYDDFEETSPPDHEMKFEIVGECDKWPEAGACVKAHVESQAASGACRLLMAAFEAEGSMRERLLHEAMNQARLALPRLAHSDIADRLGQMRMPTAVVWLEGGVVQWMVSDLPELQYLVLDADTDGNCNLTVTMENGDKAEVLPTSALLADSLPDWVVKVLEEVEAS